MEISEPAEDSRPKEEVSGSMEEFVPEEVVPRPKEEEEFGPEEEEPGLKEDFECMEFEPRDVGVII